MPLCNKDIHVFQTAGSIIVAGAKCDCGKTIYDSVGNMISIDVMDLYNKEIDLYKKEIEELKCKLKVSQDIQAGEKRILIDEIEKNQALRWCLGRLVEAASRIIEVDKELKKNDDDGLY